MAKEHRKGPSLSAGEKTRLRTCIVQRVEKPADEMIRFVLGPENEVVPDLKASLPGRGLWVSANRKDIDIANKKGLFAQGFKKKVQVYDGLSDQIEELLAQRAMQALSLCAKAGLVVAGFEKVQAILANKRLCGILFARDGSSGSIGKIRAKLKNDMQTNKIVLHECLLNSQLAIALGKPNVIHAALLSGGAAKMCLAAIKRLEDFEPSFICESIMDKDTGQ